MARDADHYEAFYADKLWRLLPEVYRAADAEQSPDEKGPLRELVERIGVQVAVLRRSIDRAWEDQSPETCDAWAVAYLGDLLATNILPYLDDRARRLDVAKTIYYRRRKGTLAVLEELASDLTQWDVKVVEFFRRLGRSRHNFDPPIGGSPRELLVAQGLIGRHSGTPAGGTANLRNASTARSSHTAFDEFAHTADFRRGRGTTGWYGIAKIGVFVWRLTSYGVAGAMPVKKSATSNEYTFDPTGRSIPLFAKGRRDTDAFGRWVSPEEWNLSGPISRALWHAITGEDRKKLYPESFAIAGVASPNTDDIGPECGRFRGTFTGPLVSYHYGFAADLGAGPYDRRQYRPDGAAFASAARTIPTPSDLSGIQASDIVEIQDSRTYPTATNLTVAAVTIRAKDKQRPVLRLTAEWTFTGASENSTLELDGLFVSGGHAVVLAGTFARVTIRSCTLDPGTAGEVAIDDRPLLPTPLRIEGRVAELVVERSILGPVVEQGTDARVESAEFTDSIVQAIDLDAFGAVLGGVVAATGAIALPDADASLTRCTVLGPVTVHRIDVSECLLLGHATAADTQRGCVRFSGWTTGSELPQKFESIALPAKSQLFTATEFGDPRYCVLTDAAPEAVRTGGEGGREMGAFAGVNWPLKKRGLLAKFEEFLPVGLVPVVIDVT